MKKAYELPCNIADALNIVGDRWTLLIIHQIRTGNKTFNDIKHILKGISSSVLSDRLRMLEEDALIASNLYSAHPPRYEYQLTPSGQALEHVLNSIVLWAKEYLQPSYKRIIHLTCGEEVSLAYYCPHCEQNVTDIQVAPFDETDLSARSGAASIALEL